MASHGADPFVVVLRADRLFGQVKLQVSLHESRHYKPPLPPPQAALNGALDEASSRSFCTRANVWVGGN